MMLRSRIIPVSLNTAANGKSAGKEKSKAVGDEKAHASTDDSDFETVSESDEDVEESAEAEEEEEVDLEIEEDEEADEEEESPLDRILIEHAERQENNPLLTNTTFTDYVARLHELDLTDEIAAILTDTSISDGKKIRLVEMQLLQLNIEPLSYEYVEMRTLIKAFIKSIHLKKKLHPQPIENCSAKAKSPTSMSGLVDRLAAMPDCTAKTEIAARVRELFKMDKTDSEYAKVTTWIDMALTVMEKCKSDSASPPTNVHTPDSLRETLVAARKCMDEEMYGIQHIKTSALLFLHKRLVAGTSAVVLGLVGPHGVGKTSLAKVIARALSTDLTIIPAAGMRDPMILSGHSYTYVGAQPGLVVNAIIRNGPNHVMLIDELDKASESVQHSLLHILDPAQNSRFVDAYLGVSVPVDVSRMVFIVSANSLDGLPRPLVDRMCICELSDYDLEEKVEILCKFTAANANVNASIESDVAKQLIRMVGINHKGMRRYAQILADIADRYRLEAALGGNAADTTVRVTEQMVQQYIDEQRAVDAKRKKLTDTHALMFL